MKKEISYTEFNCTNCNQLSKKVTTWFNRNLKQSGNNFCCLKCANTFNGKKDPLRKGRLNKMRIKGLEKRMSTFNNSLRCALHNAKARYGNKTEFNIDEEYLKSVWEAQKGICPYSKVPLILPTRSKWLKDQTTRASIDRIDSSKGYIKGNIQFISSTMNYMKNTMSHEETLAFLQLLIRNLTQKEES